MNFTFSSDQRLLQASVRQMLAKECSASDIKKSAKTVTGRSPERWARLAELGLLGLAIPEALGGSGLNEIDFILPLEETGRALLPEPVVETAVVAAPLLRDAGAADLAAMWLPRIARGEAVIAVGLATTRLVADAHTADLLLLERNGEIHAIEPSAVTISPQPSVDPSRRLFTVEWRPGPTTLVAGGRAAADLVAAAFDRGALAVAAQLAGAAQELIDVSVSYARERQQFGRPIGAFQAVKHLLSNALLQIEYARPIIYRAASSLARAAPTRGRDVSHAKVAASLAGGLAARSALQVHGAIGYTEELAAQMWMKRIWALANAWGTIDWHRERVAQYVLD
jgi:alkylation response protein AidB-like acyl-CoA dehydrogenase